MIAPRRAEGGSRTHKLLRARSTPLDGPGFDTWSIPEERDLANPQRFFKTGPGEYSEGERSPLYRLTHSPLLWDRRIAIVSTFHFIREGEFHDTLTLSEKLLTDPEELLHKATGWMLREVGKRNQPLLESFLHQHAPRMPRIMLR